MRWICQNELPDDMRIERPLPGIQPLNMDDWLGIDEVYAEQMAERVHLLKTRPDEVMAKTTGSEAAIEEALDVIVQQLQKMVGFSHVGDRIRCPDGRDVTLLGNPLSIMGQLVQEDICILQQPAGCVEHILSAAVLCFPAHWTLSEKIGRPMGRIHSPVESYTSDMQRRVQRLFDGVKVGRPLWRFNRAHAGPQLYQPRREKDFEAYVSDGHPEYTRAERQSLIRLPKTDAVLFSIHTYVVAP